ncbi:unnamed protein product [Polarella glacialis]|uniref:Sodium/calcium exchanger membrane region domain-containing protein n=1 Tax=Polarella glacialis TaxID=89957 RepID=A0A813EEA7_POLGL|nr:unnamed protein product [Polarella glacialis]
MRYPYATGGATFNPEMDGGEDRQILTVTITTQAAAAIAQYVSERSVVVVDQVVKVNWLKLGIERWGVQIHAAATCAADDEEDDDADDVKSGSGDAKKEGLSLTDRFLTGLVYPWKVLFALLVPPPEFFGGWLCFGAALVQIGVLTAMIVDLAELFGCVAGIKDEITAVTFVALGTSMPDFFASKIAAQEDDNADAAIVNVTGSNSVNVFLGIGLPWTIAAIFWKINGPTDKWRETYPEQALMYPGGAFVVIGGDLTFIVATFSTLAVIALALIRGRRLMYGCELGGPFVPKISSSFALAMIWVYYIGIVVWKAESPGVSAEQQVLTAFVALLVVLAVCAAFVPCAWLIKRLFFPNADVPAIDDSSSGDSPAIVVASPQDDAEKGRQGSGRSIGSGNQRRSIGRQSTEEYWLREESALEVRTSKNQLGENQNKNLEFWRPACV